MGMSNSPLAYQDIKAALQKALESERGVRIRCETAGQAVYLRHRINGFRKVDRNSNKKIYAPDEPMHGLSVYDAISVKVEGNTVLLVHLGEQTLEIEEL